METQNLYFAELNLTKLKELAGNCADKFPAIKKILLFKEKLQQDGVYGVPEGRTFPFQVTGCGGTLPVPLLNPFIAHRIAGLR